MKGCSKQILDSANCRVCPWLRNLFGHVKKILKPELPNQVQFHAIHASLRTSSISSTQRHWQRWKKWRSSTQPSVFTNGGKSPRKPSWVKKHHVPSICESTRAKASSFLISFLPANSFYEVKLWSVGNKTSGVIIAHEKGTNNLPKVSNSLQNVIFQRFRQNMLPKSKLIEHVNKTTAVSRNSNLLTEVLSVLGVDAYITWSTIHFSTCTHICKSMWHA